MKSSTVSLVIGTIVIIAGIYWYTSLGSGNQTPLTVSAPGGDASQVRFHALVSALGPISFDTSIFSDPLFLALTNLTSSVQPEPSGRLDPFAVVPGVTGI